MKKISSIVNGKKGGRPCVEKYITKIALDGVNTVILTEWQYNKLIDRYGFVLVGKALKILDEWLMLSPVGSKYKGKNNYAHFRSDGWLMNTARSEL